MNERAQRKPEQEQLGAHAHGERVTPRRCSNTRQSSTSLACANWRTGWPNGISSARPILKIWPSLPRPRGHSQRSSGDTRRPFLKLQQAVVTQSRWERLPVARISNGATMCTKAAAKAQTRCCPNRVIHSSTTHKMFLCGAMITAMGLALVIRAALCARRRNSCNSAYSQNSRGKTTSATVGFQVATWIDLQYTAEAPT